MSREAAVRRDARALAIRDFILKHAGLSRKASVRPDLKSRIVSAGNWRATIDRGSLKRKSGQPLAVTKLELWAHDSKVATFAWTARAFWVVRMSRGQWEADCFGQPPYLTPQQRWTRLCSQLPSDPSLRTLFELAPIPAAPEADRRTRVLA